VPLVIAISSYVAASRVGGGIAPYVLAPLKVDPVLAPTCLFGRHPGHGPPGGGAVTADMLAGVLEGVEASGLFPLCDGVLTGWFASPEQVRVAARTIDRIRAAPRRGISGRCFVLVDPVMGDQDKGLYVRPDVADAVVRELVPRADLVGPNLWETGRLGVSALAADAKPQDIVSAVRAAMAAGPSGQTWLVSSVRAGDRIGAVYVEAAKAWFAHAPLRGGAVPNGVGDLLKLAFIGRLVGDVSPASALALSVGACAAVIDRALEWAAPELPLAACQDILRDAPAAAMDEID
jgi:pyridoxine kinase